jgi:hypothetical protein
MRMPQSPITTELPCKFSRAPAASSDAACPKGACGLRSLNAFRFVRCTVGARPRPRPISRADAP